MYPFAIDQNDDGGEVEAIDIDYTESEGENGI